MDNEQKKTSFWTRRISIWHLIYIVVICLVINIFLICIAPGRIHEDAYHNFSFAATITSIVLAVVSIVYSIQSGLNSHNRMDSIRDIESKIGEELNRFTNLESSIKKAVKEGISPLEASMGDIKQRQDDIQKAQDDLSSNWKAFMQSMIEPINMDDKTKKDDEVPSLLADNDIPQIFSIILYTCQQSQQKQKDIPYHIFGRFFGSRSYFCEGVITGLSVFNPNVLKIKTGSKVNRVVVETFDQSSLGKEEWLRKQSMEGKNRKLGNAIIIALDEYFQYDNNCDETEGDVL